MKKRIGILILAVILACGLCVTAFAAGSASVTADKTTVKPGDQVKFTVSVSGRDLRGIAIVPSFDSSVFELVSGSWLISGVLKDFSGGVGVIAFESATDISGSVFSMTLRVRSGVAAGTYQVGAQVTVNDDTNGSAAVGTGSAKVTVPCDHTYTDACDDTCDKCGEKRTPPHSFGKGTPVDGSKHSRACSKCKYVQTGSHSWDGGQVTTPATEEAAGVMTYSCAVCSQTKTERIPMIPHEHKLDGAWITDENTHRHECTCGLVEDQGDHSFGGRILVRESTCAEPGQTKMECAVCGYAVTQELGVIAHSWDAGTVTKEPTAQEEGVMTYSCSGCSQTKTERVYKLDGPREPEPVQTPEGDLLLWVCIAEAVVIAGLGAVLILRKKKK